MHPKQDSHIRPLDEFKNLEGALPEDGLHKSGVLVGVSTPVGAVPNRNPPLEDRPLDAFFTYATQPSDVNDALVLVIPTGVVGKEALMQKYAEFMPSYFGKNWDALNECLHDLSWFEKKNIVIAHEEIPTMSQTDTKVYLRILAEAVQLLRAGPRTILYCHMARIVSMSAFENQCDP